MHIVAIELLATIDKLYCGTCKLLDID